MSNPQRILAPITFLLAFAPAVAMAQEWKDFTSAECRCSAQLPGMPQQRSNSLPSKFGPLDQRMITLDVPGTAFFALSYVDFPKDAFTKAKTDDILDDVRETSVSNVKGSKLRSETKVTMNGFPGREIKIDSPGKMVMHGRTYLVKERLYQLIVVMPEAREAAGDSKKFLDSFKFQKP